MKRLELLKKILERKLLMSFLIKHYEKYNKYLGRLSYFLGSLSSVFATLSKIYDNESAISTALVASSVVTLACFKIKESLAYTKIIVNGKESVIKYQDLYDKIAAEQTKGNPFQTQEPDDDFATHYREYQQIKDFEPIVEHNIMAEYQEYCKNQHIVSSIDEAAQIRELEEILISNGTEENKEKEKGLFRTLRNSNEDTAKEEKEEKEDGGSRDDLNPPKKEIIKRKQLDDLYKLFSPRSTIKRDADRLQKLISFNGTV